ncbi:type I DNA topoisomerase [Candidatus Phytoplasma ziziphi]|uniref:DNA topoisomerase 1 n=1 Tax=Ziziphus jujuba witches'-broom phytoplasma TaxID=135727 RepID=A0A660HMM4_ZIZJU|nr:type I DNA topoisomerase [Candidatus Phytoplasma ziziphi]AYJ01278.1 type I DNA topoisomerase [Candidatus Phytoplasma ziziphi]
MEKKVVILESPSKAKTISSYLGDDFLVLSSKGHIRDLALSGSGRLGVDIKNNFHPDYIIIDKQQQTVQDLIRKTKNKKVFLAMDPDREGEAIAWHLSQVLNLDKKDKNRILFNEITKSVIQKAFTVPSVINEKLVDSQETRRILDRIIGFKLSGLVKKVNAKSAGRVQSVALKLIVGLEEERKKFVPEEYNLIRVHFDNFQANLVIIPKDHKIKEEEAFQIFNKIKDKKFLLESIQNKKVIKKPPKPFITSTLQQDAFQNLSMGAKNTMITAQKLYEGVEIDNLRVGLITYMRTDSFRISDEFSTTIQSFIKKQYGKEFLGSAQTSKYNKNKNISDAHEAIRVTDITRTPDSLTKYLTKYEFYLYNMIYERTLASFMSEAVINKNQFCFKVDKYNFLAEANEMVFEGYYKALQTSFKNVFLPLLEINKEYSYKEIEIIKKMTTPPSRFTEASLIKELEHLKIGRPSTYASIIEILKKRSYVIIDDKKMVCTELGVLTKETLDKFFSSIINVEYTAQMEKKLDEISSGKVDKLNLLKEFYNDFIELYDMANQKIEKPKPIVTEEKCDLCGSFLVKRQGKYGDFLGCGAYPKCKKIISLKTKKEEVVETEEKCDLCGAFLVKRKGRYGDFLGCSSYPKCKKIVSLNQNLKKR